MSTRPKNILLIGLPNLYKRTGFLKSVCFDFTQHRILSYLRVNLPRRPKGCGALRPYLRQSLENGSYLATETRYRDVVTILLIV